MILSDHSFPLDVRHPLCFWAACRPTMLWPSGRRCGCETGLGSIAALLGKNPGKVPAYDASPLNAGVFFDIEADRVWRKFSDQPLGADRLWFYLVDAPWLD